MQSISSGPATLNRLNTDPGHERGERQRKTLEDNRAVTHSEGSQSVIIILPSFIRQHQ